MRQTIPEIDKKKLYKALKREGLLGKTLLSMSAPDIYLLAAAIMASLEDNNKTKQRPFCRAYPAPTGFPAPTKKWCIEAQGDWCKKCIWRGL